MANSTTAILERLRTMVMQPLASLRPPAQPGDEDAARRGGPAVDRHGRASGPRARLRAAEGGLPPLGERGGARAPASRPALPRDEAGGAAAGGAVGKALLGLDPYSAHMQPEKRLMLAVLYDAVATFTKHIDSCDLVGVRLCAEAEQWFASDDTAWPFSFANICDALGLSACRIRAFLAEVRAKSFRAEVERSLDITDERLWLRAARVLAHIPPIASYAPGCEAGKRVAQVRPD